MAEISSTSMRWDPYILVEGDNFDEFWRNHLSGNSRKVLFLLGRGFDPRALKALKHICNLGTLPNVWEFVYDNEREDSTVRRQLTEKNHNSLISLVGNKNVKELPLKIGLNYANKTSTNTVNAIREQGPIINSDDVVVDISAMPRLVALSAVTKLIHDLDKLSSEGTKDVNLHVVTAESVKTDLASTGSLMEDVTHLYGFSGQLNAMTTETVPRVWFPVLGEGQLPRLEKIREILNPDEICPVVPFPSRNPRRGDEIISEYVELLFEDFRVEPQNILRASEINPFEAYRQLFLAMDRYRQALTELGGCKAFVSPLSSKLLSVGVLLACYDHKFGNIVGDKLKVGIPYVETSMYEDPSVQEEDTSKLFSMWIRGEWEQ